MTTATSLEKSTLVPQPIAGQQRYHGDDIFPLVFSPGTDTDLNLQTALAILRSQKQALLDALGRHGAIVLRGFPVVSDWDFDAVVSAFGLPGFTYAESLSNAVRRNRTPQVFTANEAPPDVAIYLHHEMAQTPVYPSALFFFCEHAAHSGGATPLCRSDILLARLQQQLPEFVRDCERKGVRYANTMPADDDPQSGQGRSWRSTLKAADRESAEARLQTLGYAWEWLEDDSLKATTPVLSAVRQLPNGRRVFFNQLIAAYRGWQDRRNDASKSIRFGDDTAIPEAAMRQVIELGDELTFDLQWQTGDVALVDNFLVMHGRRPYAGERRVLASLVA